MHRAADQRDNDVTEQLRRVLYRPVRPQAMSLERAVASACTAPGSGRGSLRYWRPLHASCSIHDDIALDAGSGVASGSTAAGSSATGTGADVPAGAPVSRGAAASCGSAAGAGVLENLETPASAPDSAVPPDWVLRGPGQRGAPARAPSFIEPELTPPQAPDLERMGGAGLRVRLRLWSRRALGPQMG